MTAMSTAAIRETVGCGSPLEIRGEGLSKVLGGVRAIWEVNFKASAAQITAVIGPNGAGKTTLLNVATGAVKPGAGFVEVRHPGEDGGVVTSGLKPYQIAQLGVARTFQLPRVFDDLSVADNIRVGCESARRRFGRELSRASRFDALAELARLSVGPRTMASELRFADRRRLEIARALAGAPSAILMDEPTSGLDQSEAAEVKELVAVLRSVEMSVVIVSHDVALVMAVADWVVVLDTGKVVFEGPAREVRSSKSVRDAYLAGWHE